MASFKPVVVIVTAGDCPHCHHFSPEREKLIALLQNNSNVTYLDVKLKSMRDKLSDYFTQSNISDYVRWFPTISIHDGQAWNSGKTKGFIYSSKEENGQIRPGKAPLVADAIMAWVNSQYPKLTSSSPSSLSPSSPSSNVNGSASSIVAPLIASSQKGTTVGPTKSSAKGDLQSPFTMDQALCGKMRIIAKSNQNKI